MIIQELQIKNFGKFSDRKFSFGPGLNLVYGENESGKTTLHTYIKSCFYGLRKGRGRAAGKDSYSRYEPWDNPAYYAGNIRFQCAGKTFRLERDFQNPKNRELLVCETDGERLSLEHGDLDMLLGGVGEAVFENTVFVSQMKSKTDESLAEELKNYIANYQDGDSSVDVQESLKILKTLRKEQEKKILEAKKKAEEQKGKLLSRIQYIQEELQKNQDEWRELEDVRRSLEKQGTVPKVGPMPKNGPAGKDGSSEKGSKSPVQVGETGKNSQHSVWNRKVWLPLILLLVLAGTGLIWFMYRSGSPSVSLISCAAVAYILAVGFLARGVLKAKKGLHAKQDEKTGLHVKVDSEKGSYMEAGPENNHKWNPEQVSWELDHLAQEIKEKQLQIANLQEEINAQTDADDREAKKNLEAIRLAAVYIEETVADIQVYVGKRLNERTSELLSELTDGKYTAVELDEDLQPAVHTAERYIPIEQLSRGTMEQVYLALRMAAGEIFCEEEQLPVILDDVFAMYDEERLAKALQWLARQRRQVLIFTCHKREEQLLRQLGIPFHKVQM